MVQLLARRFWPVYLERWVYQSVRCLLYLLRLFDILPQIQKYNIDILRSKEGTALVLSLAKRQMWVNFTGRRQRRWDQPQCRSGIGWEEDTPSPCRESNPNRPSCSHSFYWLNCHGLYCPSLKQILVSGCIVMLQLCYSRLEDTTVSKTRIISLFTALYTYTHLLHM